MSDSKPSPTDVTKVLEAAQTLVVEPLTPWVFGSPAPEELRRSLKEGTVSYIPPQFLSVKRGYNVRDFDSVENQTYVSLTPADRQGVEASLADSILANGLENPLRVAVEGDRIQVIQGESRLRSILNIATAGKKPIETVAVLPVARKNAQQATIDFIVSNSGKNLQPLESLSVVNRLKSEGMEAKVIRRALGFSHTTMANLVTLDSATPAMKDTIREGLLTATWMIEKSGLKELGQATDLSEEDHTVRLNAVEKKVLRIAKARREAGQQAAKGSVVVDPDAPEKADGRKEPVVSGISYSRAAQNALLGALADIREFTRLRDWKGAPDAFRKRASKVNKIAANALSAAGAPNHKTETVVPPIGEADPASDAG